MSKSRQKTEPQSQSDFLQIGQIVGTHGVKGGLKVLVLTDFPARFDPGQTVFIRKTPHKVQRTTWHKGQARVQVEGIKDMTTAETLKWEAIEVPSESRPELEPGQVLATDLVGMAVVDAEGTVLGYVEDVVSAPAQDLLQVAGSLIPMVQEFVKDVDEANRTITVRLIPGLLDPSEADVDDPARSSQ